MHTSLRPREICSQSANAQTIAAAFTLQEVLLITMLVAGLIGPVCVKASVPGAVVDQDFSVTPPTRGGVNSLSAQTFTVGVAGWLSGADLLVFDGSQQSGQAASDISVQLRTVVSGLPGSNILATGTIPSSVLLVSPGNQFTHVDFVSLTAVVPGEQLALAISGVSDGWSGHVGSAATYAGGQACVFNPLSGAWVPYSHVDPGGRQGDDLFRTYVVPVPEPSIAVLLIVTAATLAAGRCVKGQKCKGQKARI